MASTPEAVEFTHEVGLVTARDVECAVDSVGGTNAEALAMLAEALGLRAGGGEPAEGEAAVLEELGPDPEEIADARAEHDELPEFLR